MAEAQKEQKDKDQKPPQDNRDGPGGRAPVEAGDAGQLVSLGWSGALGSGLLLFAILLTYLLIATWPVPNANGPGYVEFSIFGCDLSLGCEGNPVSVDVRLLITVALAGMLGSTIHVLTSFADYAANRQLLWSWVLWFFMRLPAGMALALTLYLVVRGSLSPSVQGVQGVPPPGGGVPSPYSYAAIAVMAGMFSKQATDKLREIFEILFTQKNPVTRNEALSPVTLSISGTVPPRLTVGDLVVLVVNGHGFQAGSKVTLGGRSRVVEFVSEAQIKVTLVAEDVAKPGKLELVVVNTAPVGSVKTTIEVVEGAKPAPAKPQIAPETPKALTPTSPTALSVTGQGFQSGITATINGQDRKVAFVDDKKLTVTLLDVDLKESELKLVLKNPGLNAPGSDVYIITVK